MPTGVYDRTKSKPNAGEFGKRPPWNKGKTGIYSKDMLRRLSNAGKKNRYAWKGGRYKNSDGYILIYMPNHPHRTSISYVREHRVVVEKQIGRYLLPKEQVHHLGDRGDNQPHVLMAFKSDKAHKRFEHGLSFEKSEIIFDGRKIKENLK